MKRRKIKDKIIEELYRDRPIREENKNKLKGFFGRELEWKKHWWGMPNYEMNDAMPAYRITINFMTKEDLYNFRELTGLNIGKNSSSAWYPEQKKLEGGKYRYIGPKVDSRYPICIPSKGRWDCQLTGKVLDKMGVSYKFFVEETESDLYREYIGEDKVIELPFNNLGKGSIPARNFIWEWAKEREYKRHWVVDDNIINFGRTTYNRRLRVYSGSLFRAMEDFVDRYKNIALAGPHHRGFIPDRYKLAPYLLNHRVYSCILIDTNLDYRWRGRYNEDTDLSLRVLKDEYCTLLFRALYMEKFDTLVMKGGNTDNVYNTGDNRREFAESLKRFHPDVVKVIWRYNRWHHLVDYGPFKNNKLILREDIVPNLNINEYGMKLVKKKNLKKRRKDKKDK